MSPGANQKLAFPLKFKQAAFQPPFSSDPEPSPWIARSASRFRGSQPIERLFQRAARHPPRCPRGQAFDLALDIRNVARDALAFDRATQRTRRQRAPATKRPVVVNIDPPQPGRRLANGEDWNRRVVAMQPIGDPEIALDQRVEGTSASKLSSTDCRQSSCAPSPRDLSA
jgi:hypothetical protein